MSDVSFDATFDRYADTVPWKLKIKRTVGYPQFTDYRHCGRQVRVASFIHPVSKNEMVEVAKAFNLECNIGTGGNEVRTILFRLYDELPRQILEIPMAIGGFYLTEDS